MIAVVVAALLAVTFGPRAPGDAAPARISVEVVPVVHPTPEGGPGPGNIIATISNISFPQGLAFDPVTGELFVADDTTNNVSVLWTNNDTLKENVTVGGAFSDPFGEAFVSSLDELFVSDSSSDNLTVVNTTSLMTTASIPTGADPYELAYDPSNGDLYVADDGENNTTVIDAATGTVETPVNLGGEYGPFGVAYDPTNNLVYVTESEDDNVSVIDPGTSSVTKMIAIPGANMYSTSDPEGIALDPADGDLYVADTSNDTLSVINASSNELVGSIPTGYSPEGVAYDPTDGFLYVTNGYATNVSVINPANGSDFYSIPVGGEPFPVLFDPSNNDVYVGNELSDNVSVIATSALPPVLSKVRISPATTTLSVHANVVLSASMSCTWGPCPAGATYNWSVGNGLGSLNATHGRSVVFTAGGATGTDPVSVNATLQSVTVAAVPASITITSGPIQPKLTSVLISPGSASLQTSATQSFGASPLCSNGACPPGTTYNWSLSSDLGTLNATTGSIVRFTASSTPGNLSVSVRATLNGTSVDSAPASISISSPAPPPPAGHGSSGSLFNSADALYVGLGVAAVAAAALVVFVIGRSRKRKREGSEPPT